MIGHQIPLPLVLLLLAVLGAYAGRFLNACIKWFPQHDLLRDQLRALTAEAKVCARCSAQPSRVERIPVFGWLISGGRCPACRSRVSIEPPVIEAVTAILFVFVYWCEIPIGPDARLTDSVLAPQEGVPGPEMLQLWSPVIWLHLRYVLHMLMICCLIVATAIDRRLRIIPDGSTVPMMLLALVAGGMFGQLFIVPIWFQDASTVRKFLLPLIPNNAQPYFEPWSATAFVHAWPHLHGLLVGVVGAIVGAGSVWIVRLIGFWVLKQEAMGFGDVVLMAMIGSVIGWQPVLVVFVLAPMLAIFAAIINWVAHRDNEIPYGPFLSGATVLLLFTWPQVWPLAKRFFDMGLFLIPVALFMAILLATSLQFVQILKRLLGISLHHDADDDDWSSADHLIYYGREKPDEQTGQWPTEQWPGSRAGKGLLQEHSWKHGPQR